MTNTVTTVPTDRSSRLFRRFKNPRARLLLAAGVVLTTSFWLLTRYPALLDKANAVGGQVASMTFASEVWAVAADAPLLLKVLAGAVNWLWAMKIGMTFGVLLGALLHTTLRHFPLRVGSSVMLNSVKGAVIGAPMGVCANCAVPTACGVTRGDGRLETALGFLFSSPSFNPVVVTMTIAALPAAMVATKYAVLVLMIVVGVPLLVRFFSPDSSGAAAASESEEAACAIPGALPKETVASVAPELGKQFLGHVWMLAKPTIAIMLVASILSSIALVLLPLDELLANPTVANLGIASIISTLMPVPIALDVLFAAQLQSGGVAAGFVMLFATTLGTYSVVPAIYLWREVSRGLSLALLAFFTLLGWGLAVVFQQGWL